MIAELTALAQLCAGTLLLPGVLNESRDQAGNGMFSRFHIDAQAMIVDGRRGHRPDRYYEAAPQRLRPCGCDQLAYS